MNVYFSGLHIKFFFQSDPWFYGHPYRWIFYDINQGQIGELEKLPFLTDSNNLMAVSEKSNTLTLTQCTFFSSYLSASSFKFVHFHMEFYSL